MEKILIKKKLNNYTAFGLIQELELISPGITAMRVSNGNYKYPVHLQLIDRIITKTKNRGQR